MAVFQGGAADGRRKEGKEPQKKVADSKDAIKLSLDEQAIVIHLKNLAIYKSALHRLVHGEHPEKGDDKTSSSEQCRDEFQFSISPADGTFSFAYSFRRELPGLIVKGDRVIINPTVALEYLKSDPVTALLNRIREFWDKLPTDYAGGAINSTKVNGLNADVRADLVTVAADLEALQAELTPDKTVLLDKLKGRSDHPDIAQHKDGGREE